MKRVDPLCYYPPMARTEIILTVDALDPQSARGKLCVVIDVLRASTTIVAALAAGCPEIIPVETPEEARRLARTKGLLLGGERNSLRPEGFDFGNSPLEYTPEKIKGRPIAFTTTNGTRAMETCRQARCVLLGAFVNLHAVIGDLEENSRGQDEAVVHLVCAGTHGKSLVKLGFGPDIDFAATLNKYDIAPVRKGEAIVRETA